MVSLASSVLLLRLKLRLLNIAPLVVIQSVFSQSMYVLTLLFGRSAVRKLVKANFIALSFCFGVKFISSIFFASSCFQFLIRFAWLFFYDVFYYIFRALSKLTILLFSLYKASLTVFLIPFCTCCISHLHHAFSLLFSTDLLFAITCCSNLPVFQESLSHEIDFIQQSDQCS